jgi:type IV pilus assembly protein PilM
VDMLSGVIRDVGLAPLAVDIEPLALYRTLTAAENSLVVDIGAEVSHVMVFQDGGPVFTRTIPLGGNRFTEVVMRALDLESGEADKLKKQQLDLLPRTVSSSNDPDVHSQMGMLVNDLANEIRRTLAYFQRQNKEAVLDKLFLSGGGSRLGNLAEQLSIQLDMPVVLHDPLAVVEVEGSYDPQYVRELGPQLAVAIGLALRGGES